MTESDTTNANGVWTVPQCPFPIEYSARVMDDIRLAVMDAFFSLPRGGAEIGGVLIGSFQNNRVTITDYVALDCEHAFGPSFTLSPRDEGKLEELLAANRQTPAGVPVGWYHSHTRSEIFLSDADLAIHKRFFPEPWQVALVLKPHTFQPMRGGFFFREPGGAIQAASTYRELTLDAVPMRPVPSGGMPLPSETAKPELRQPLGGAKVIDVSVTHPVAPAPALEKPPAPKAVPPKEAEPKHTEPEPQPQAKTLEPPSFLSPPPEQRPRAWLKPMLIVLVGIGLGAAAYQGRQLWWPKLMGLFTPPAATDAFAPLGLSTIDAEGQLQIHWDRYSSAIRQATGGRLSITDTNPVPREFKLDPVRLQSGNFTYVREGESVTVVLTLDEPKGQQLHEVSTFLGKLPKPATAGEDPEVRKQRDALAQETARLRQELATQVDRNRRLQKALEESQTQLREQMRRRITNQIPK